MNQAMWAKHPTQKNRAILSERGIHFLGPDSGLQACGEVGAGRLLDIDALLLEASALFATGRLQGKTVLITAGPTREAIDPVRFISNHSSGKQGYAVAAAAARAGARVVLVSGPVGLPAPPGVDRVSVESAADMHAAVTSRLDNCDVFIGVAAVADYRPSEVAPQKMKKPDTGPADLTLTLTQNPDIIADVARHTPRPLVVGFAAETERVLEHGRAKRARKGMDLIVVNDVSDPTIGFNSDQNAVTLISAAGERTLPRSGKDAVAAAILEAVAEQLTPAGRGG